MNQKNFQFHKKLTHKVNFAPLGNFHFLELLIKKLRIDENILSFMKNLDKIKFQVYKFIGIGIGMVLELVLRLIKDGENMEKLTPEEAKALVGQKINEALESLRGVRQHLGQAQKNSYDKTLLEIIKKISELQKGILK